MMGIIMLGFLVVCLFLVMASDIWETWTWHDKVEKWLEEKEDERDS